MIETHKILHRRDKVDRRKLIFLVHSSRTRGQPLTLWVRNGRIDKREFYFNQ